MTEKQLHQGKTGIQDVAGALRSRLQRYIESAYYLRDTTVVQERHALLEEPSIIAREPFLETTPSYELSQAYGQLSLPEPVGKTLDEFAKLEPSIGIYPQPYRHQAEALEAFLQKQQDLIVSTGTGSGKTETFLLPIISNILLEAHNRPVSFVKPGMRALILYPMNALVSDQIARLRRCLGDNQFSAIFRQRYGRHPRFGMYTSRTPYPGLRNSDKDPKHVAKILQYYIDLEKDAENNPEKAHLKKELQQRGRWPAKNLLQFYGEEGGHWNKRLLTQAEDRELFTRHEMQTTCPDVLITNYSMLEYMLMRPIEQSIFRQTRDWLASDPDNTLILVVDEAHLYRGTAGAEVAYLIRRLQARLGIPRDRMRCILTSASLGPDDTVQEDALRFAHELTGKPVSRTFQLIRGYREPRPPAKSGNEEEAYAFADFEQQALANRVEDLDGLRQALAALAQQLDWPAITDTMDLPQYLYAQLDHLGSINLLIEQTTGHATALQELAGILYPNVQPDIARRAAETLLSLGTYAHNGKRPLLQTRVHMFFRGLPSLWACVNSKCSVRRVKPQQGEALVGRIYTEPRTHCECGARVYELLAHRHCGAVFLRAFSTDKEASFYWHENRRLSYDTPALHEEWLVLEKPHKQQQKKVCPIWMDIKTGRVVTDSPEEEGYRLLWRANKKENKNKKNKQEEQPNYSFDNCPICTHNSPKKIGDLTTRGELPFANIVHEQFALQAPSQKISETLPNGGRKVLLFSDGRQKAARLARDLPREMEFHTFRHALVMAIHRLHENGIDEVLINPNLYAAFVSVCHDHRLHFFDQEYNSQPQLLQHIRDFSIFYDANLASALQNVDHFSEYPVRYRQYLLDLLCNPFYSVYQLGVLVVKPSKQAINLIKKSIPALPDIIKQEVELLATFWMQEMLEHGAFDSSIEDIKRKQVLIYSRPPSKGDPFNKLEKVFKEVTGLEEQQLAQLREALYGVLTGTDKQNLRYLKPNVLSLHLAFDATWYRCNECGLLLHETLLDHCAICGGSSLTACQPDDPLITARYDYYREPLRAALQDIPPTHITAEEHTAQLSQRDAGEVYATTEEFELRFQDITLGEDKPPVDVLSCTTTMEVGIDIGSLVAIGLRNVPPQRENYQQRAGRAGRRGSAVSTVVTYADTGPHDNHYYHNPEIIIAGPPRRPLLKIDRHALVKRHINAYLIQTFFHEQTEYLDPKERKELELHHNTLFTALGTKVDFFEGDGAFSFGAFQQWLNNQVVQSSDVIRTILDWIPEEVIPEDETPFLFIQQTVRELVEKLQSLPPSQPEDKSAQDYKKGNLLDLLFASGILPTYAFPTDVVSFYIFGHDGNRIFIKERPQQNKLQALSEYAPGRLLVVNKETYRVGGIHTGNIKQKSVQHLFESSLPIYIFCPNCTFIGLGKLSQHKQCPICSSELKESELLDPPGFAPEKGQPVQEQDNEQEFTYAVGAQLPLPVASDTLTWHKGNWSNLVYAYAQNHKFVEVNRGKQNTGFTVCESCGAMWLSGQEEESHSRPYITLDGQYKCRGKLRSSVYLGTSFRSDLLLIRASMQPSLHYSPTSPWLQDALRTITEALSLTASRELDVDPAEISAGYRYLPLGENGQAQFDLYLFDTASGGAGYASEAGDEIGKILEKTLATLEHCPQDCQRSCTRCLRHYGNRFLHESLDRKLAAQLLRHLLYGEVPLILPVVEQRKQLAALQRFLELEGWDVQYGAEQYPLIARNGNTIATVSTYPALLNFDALNLPPYSGYQAHVYIRDYIVDRDLPSAYAEMRKTLRM